MTFWIATYSNRLSLMNNSVSWPVFQDEAPSLNDLLELYPDFADKWQGVGRLDNKAEREGENIKVDGPFTIPIMPLCEECDDEGDEEAEYIVLVDRLKQRNVTSDDLSIIVNEVMMGRTDAINDEGLEYQVGCIVSEVGVEAATILLQDLLGGKK